MIIKGNTATIRGWAFYDWANSVYSLIINATLFPIYYENITNSTTDIITFWGHPFINTALYTYALAFAYLLIACLSPLLSGVADYSGRKKRFMQFFCYLGSASCAGLYFFTAGHIGLGLSLVILATIGFSGSIVFYNAFLPEIASKDQQDYASAQGFALGYLGSTILLVFNLSMLLKPDWYGGISGEMAARVSFVTVGLWWAGFAQIPFWYLQDSPRKVGKEAIWKGYLELAKVFRELKQTPALKKYLTAYFFYNMGVQTVILLATLFGKKELHISTSGLIIVIMIIQWVAIIGAYFFSYLSGRIGNLPALMIATLVWVLVCLDAYFIKTAAHFYVLAFFVGFVMGGIQSLSRSTYSKMLPQTANTASYFSFYDICEKVGIVIGMGLFGLVETWTSSMRAPILSLIAFFLLGGKYLMQTSAYSRSQKTG